jgi:hypothetical protein
MIQAILDRVQADPLNSAASILTIVTVSVGFVRWALFRGRLHQPHYGFGPESGALALMFHAIPVAFLLANGAALFARFSGAAGAIVATALYVGLIVWVGERVGRLLRDALVPLSTSRQRPHPLQPLEEGYFGTAVTLSYLMFWGIFLDFATAEVHWGWVLGLVALGAYPGIEFGRWAARYSAEMGWRRFIFRDRDARPE